MDLRYILNLSKPAPLQTPLQTPVQTPVQNPATEPAPTRVELPGTGTLEPQVSPDLLPETRQHQAAWQAQSPVPILISIPVVVVNLPAMSPRTVMATRTQEAPSPVPVPLPVPPTPQAPTPVIPPSYLFTLKMPPPMPTSAAATLTESQHAIVDRVRRDAKKFEDLWKLGQWLAAHSALKSLGKSYPFCRSADDLLPELSAAHKAMEEFGDPVTGFLLGSAHCFNRSPVSSQWKRLLRHQPLFGATASMEHVITRGPLKLADARTFAQAIQGTMVRLSWLLPDWGMAHRGSESHDERIQKALVQLFDRLGELHKTAQRTGWATAFLSQIQVAVTARYCSPELRATLDTFKALPQWLAQPLRSHLHTIDRNAGAELFPSNGWMPREEPGASISSHPAPDGAPDAGGIKRALDEVRPPDDEQARQRSRTDAHAGTPVRFVIPGTGAATPSSAQALLAAVRTMNLAAVEDAVGKNGAWTAEAQTLAQRMVSTSNSTVTSAILRAVTSAAPPLLGNSSAADPRLQES